MEKHHMWENLRKSKCHKKTKTTDEIRRWQDQMQIKKKIWLIMEPQQLKLFGGWGHFSSSCTLQPTFWQRAGNWCTGVWHPCNCKAKQIQENAVIIFISLKKKLFEEDEVQAAVKSFNKRGHSEKYSICTTGENKKSKKITCWKKEGTWRTLYSKYWII